MQTATARYAMIVSRSKEEIEMLPERLYTLRRKRGLSQEALAEAIGVSRQAVSKWETGSSTPELDKLKALSTFFGVTVDELTSDDVSHAAETEDSKENTVEVPPAPCGDDENRVKIRARLGIALCVASAVCLILFGILMIFSPSRADVIKDSSAITLDGSGIFMLLCVLSMLVGTILLLRKK